MRILVIGSEGNIGKKLVPYLRKMKHKVIRADIKQGFADDYFQTDICSPLDLFNNEIMKFKPKVIYHLAAMVSRITCEKVPHLTIDTNVNGTMNVIQLCKLLDAKLINFSTSEVYGNTKNIMSECDIPNPNNLYGLSKWIAEQLIKYEVSNGLKAITVRPFMIYDEDETLGIHRSAMIRFVENLIQGNKIQIHKGAIRSWLHIDDAVVAFEELLNDNVNITINISNPLVNHIEFIVKIICEQLGLKFEDMVEIIDLPEKITLVKLTNFTIQKQLLKFEPKINIEEGIERVINKVKKRIK